MDKLKSSMRDNLELTLNKLINQEIDNNSLINSITKEFNEKGLNPMVISTIFNEETRWDILNEMVKIAFIQGAYNELKWDSLNPQKIFSSQLLNEYQLYQGDKEEKIDIIELKNFRKDTETLYSGKLSYKDIYLFKKNGLLFYNSKTQRASEFKTIGTEGFVIRKININAKATEEIANLMLKGDYHPDTIILNSRIINGKEMNFRDTCKSNEFSIYDIDIKPNYDTESESQTVVDILDGFHRIIGVCKAVEKYKKMTGKWLEGFLFVDLVTLDEEDARNVTAQTFERSDTDNDWKSVLKTDDYTRFTDSLINKVDLLKNNVADTYEEYKVYGNITHKNILIKAIKQTGIKVESKSQSVLALKAISETLNNIVDYLSNTFFAGNLENLKKSHLLDCNFFYGYIVVANILSKKPYEDLAKFCDDLYLTITDKNFNITYYKSGAKVFAPKTIANLFLKIMNEEEI